MLKEIPIELIDMPNESLGDSRLYRDDSWLEFLSSDIEREDVFSPIIVRPKDNGKYEIVAGVSRFLASKMSGKSSIPCNVLALNDMDVLFIRVKENMFRRSPDYMGIAKDVKRLHDSFGLKLKEITDRFHLSKSFVSKLYALNSLSPEDQSAVSEGSLSIEMAYKKVMLERLGDKEFPHETHLEACHGCRREIEPFRLTSVRLCMQCIDLLRSTIDKRKESEKKELESKDQRLTEFIGKAEDE